MESTVPKKITARRFLIRDLARNIELNKGDEYEFNGYVFSINDDTSYYVSAPDGNDVGIVNINEITEPWLKMRCNKSQKKDIKPMNQSRIKSKPRKVKKYDIIINDFMAHLHTRKCIVDGCEDLNLEAHHVYGRQPLRHDILCVPLCANHHRGSTFSVHEGDVKSFRKEYTKSRMERLAIEELGSWVNGSGSSVISDSNLRLFADLIPFLLGGGSGYNLRIKEFLIEYERNQCEEG